MHSYRESAGAAHRPGVHHGGMTCNRDADDSELQAPARPGGRAGRVRVESLDGVLAVVPHLLGFHPSSSLVVLGIGGPGRQIKVAFRYDLPDPPDPSQAAEIAAHATAVLRRQDLPSAMTVGYGSGSLVTPVTDLLRGALSGASIEIRDQLRVEDGRYWSYLCADPRCCPAEGVRFDVLRHPAAAALSAAGLTALSDRASLAHTLAPATAAAGQMRRATERAVRRAAALNGPADQGRSEAGARLLAESRRSVQEALARYRSGKAITDHDTIAWLTVALSDLRVRDDAWARMDPDFAVAHRRLWTDLLRHAIPRLVPAPAALLAFTAWQGGEGALAIMAVERALAADPGYSMALLLGEAVQAGLPPSAARLPMTPEQVEASYATAGPAASGSRPVSGSDGTGGPRPASGSRSVPGPGSGPGSAAGSGQAAG